MIMRNTFWVESEAPRETDAGWEYEDAYEETCFPEDDWPVPPPSFSYLSEGTTGTTSWAEAAPGGCFFSLALPPLLVLFVGALFALWVWRVPPASSPAASSAPSFARPVVTAETGGDTLAPLFTPQVQYWREDILRWARQWGMDPNLVATVMQIESCGNPRARSRAGATGLFQVMPYHFRPGENPWDPDTNALRGLAYLQKSLDAFAGDVRLALAGYNGGIGGARGGEAAWAAETARYVYWGTGVYQDARRGKKKSARLDEWLGAGGDGLCRKAKEILR